MDPKSSISSVDVPTEEPFNCDSLILDGVNIVQETTPDGVVPVVQMFPTTAFNPVTPPSDQGQLPDYLRLFEIVYSGKIDDKNRYQCNLRQLKRIAYYSKMFAYTRPNYIIRLDIRPPVGDNYQIKAYGVPGNYGFDDVKGYSGCTFWTSEITTIYFRINYTLKDYLIDNLDTITGSLYYDVISHISREGNPVPCSHTLSVFCPELNPSVTRFVDPLLIPDVGVVPLGRSNITVQLSQVTRDGRLSWVWSVVSLGIGFVFEAIFPGTGNVVKAAVDFALTVIDKFTYARVSPNDLVAKNFSIGEPVYWKVDEETNCIQVSNNNLKWWYVLEYSSLGEITYVNAGDASGSMRNMLGSMYADSAERYTQCIFSAKMDNGDVAPYIGNLYWPSASAGWFPNIPDLGRNSSCAIGQVQGSNSNANGASLRIRSDVNAAFNILTTKDAANHVASIELDNSGVFQGAVRLKNVGHVPVDSGILFGLFKPQVPLLPNAPFDFKTNLLTRLDHFTFIAFSNNTGEQRYCLGAYKTAVSEPNNDRYYIAQISKVEWYALAVGLVTDGTGQAHYRPLMWTQDDFGKDATGVYFRPVDPSLLIGCMGARDLNGKDYTSPFTVNDVGIKSAGNPTADQVELDFTLTNPNYYRLEKSQIPTEQMNQKPIVHPTGSGAMSGNTDKDPGAASIDVSDEQLPATVHKPAGSTSSRPLGFNTVNVDADRDIMIPFWTMDLVKDLQVATRITPLSWGPSGSKNPTHAQYEAMRHMYVGPRDVAGKSKFCYYKITTTANAFSNGRIIAALIPPIYTAEQITAMSAQDISQFPRKEHVLHGPETIIDVSWMLKYPMMDAYNIDDHNGYLVLRVLEFDSAADSTAPRLTVWVRPGENMKYSIPIPPRTYRSPDSGKYLVVPSKHQRELLNVVANANLQDDIDADILEKLYIVLQNNLKIHDIIQPCGIKSLYSTPK